MMAELITKPLRAYLNSDNKERKAKYHKEWASKNKDYLLEYRRNYYKRKRGESLLRSQVAQFVVEQTPHVQLPIIQIEFNLFSDCYAQIVFYGELSDEAIDKLLRHLELHRGIYPSRD